MAEQGEEVVANVGIDWADREHVICLQAEAGSGIEQLRIDTSAEALHACLGQLRQRFGAGKVAVALEQSRGALIEALRRYDFVLIYPINPKSLACFRESFRASGSKDDPNDAELLLELVRLHRHKLQVLRPDTVLTRKLQRLQEQRRQLVDDRTRLSNRLEQALKGYFPQALQWVGALAEPLASEFLRRWPTLSAFGRARASQLEQLLRGCGCKKVQERVQHWLQQRAQAVELSDDEAVIESSTLLVQKLVEQLQLLRKHIGAYDEKIAAAEAQHPDRELWRSFPGAGAVLGPRLLVAFGTDRSRWTEVRQLQQSSAIAPVTRQSGRLKCAQHRFKSNSFVKQTFHEFAKCSLPCCGWAHAYYQLQLSRGKGHHCAVRALAFKWQRIQFRCWQNATPYDEAIHLESLRRHDSPLLQYLDGATKNRGTRTRTR